MYVLTPEFKQDIKLLLELNIHILKILERDFQKMADDLTQLTTDVQNEITIESSAVTLLTGLKQQLDAAGTDPAALANLSSQIEASSAALSAAIVANTPVAALIPPSPTAQAALDANGIKPSTGESG